MTSGFSLRSNELCDDIPAGVQALSAQVSSSSWSVTTGNDRLGCYCWSGSFEVPTSTTVAEWASDTTSVYVWRNGYTGTLPTQLGLLTKITRFYTNGNSFTGVIPTEVTRI